jgi:hypothetical protein
MKKTPTKKVKKSEHGYNETHKPKRIRPDRKDKLEKRKTHNERVVKSCLLRYLNGDMEKRKTIQKVIQERVEAFQKELIWQVSYYWDI